MVKDNGVLAEAAFRARAAKVGNSKMVMVTATVTEEAVL
jgi:hypothetical protein